MLVHSNLNWKRCTRPLNIGT